ncbi:MAG: hypothetical protein ACKO47_00130 [Alphaproteobacteria bacterium]
MIRNKSEYQDILSTPISSEYFSSIFNRQEEMLKKPDNIKFQDNDPKTVTEIPNKNCLDTPPPQSSLPFEYKYHYIGGIKNPSENRQSPEISVIDLIASLKIKESKPREVIRILQPQNIASKYSNFLDDHSRNLIETVIKSQHYKAQPNISLQPSEPTPEPAPKLLSNYTASNPITDQRSQIQSKTAILNHLFYLKKSDKSVIFLGRKTAIEKSLFKKLNCILNALNHA